MNYASYGDGHQRPSRPWERVLYKQQDWPDNHTSSVFLTSLTVNDNVPKRSYKKVVLQTFPLLQHLSAVVFVGCQTYSLYMGSLTAGGLLLRCACYAVLGWTFTALARPTTAPNVFPSTPWSAAASMTQLALATGLLSPLYSTLTLSISSDSVVACVIGLSVAHLYLADYHPMGYGPASSVQGSLSVGAILAAAILVASRLPAVADVAAQLLLSLLAFVLWPYGCQQVRAGGPLPSFILTAIMLLGANVALVAISLPLAGLFVLVTAFLGGLCPLWLVRAHKFKAKINGPWDEAVPSLGEGILTDGD